jgi:two-component system NtrC family sensor kinase
MLGYDSKEELLSRTLADLLPDAEQRRLLRLEVDTQPMLQGREMTLYRKDGSPIICLNTAAVVRDTMGKVVRYHGALMDITERREMERRLYQQQEFARRLVDSFPDLIFVLDAAGRYTFTSPRVKEILGYDAEDYDTQELGERTHVEDRPALQSLFAEMFEGRQSFASLEICVRHKTGEWRRIRCHFSPLCDETGKIDGVIISGRDVTDLKRLEEQLIQAEKLAAMGQMLAGVAHELNNPLTAILGYSQLLTGSPDVGTQGVEYAEKLYKQAQRTHRIVQNLLSFARQHKPERIAVQINQILDETLALRDYDLRMKNIRVHLELSPDLPVTAADPHQLQQVFLNLVNNAVDAVLESASEGDLWVHTGLRGDRLIVEFTDSGPGVREPSKVFDPFYTTKPVGKGTGLGLSICYGIVTEHGGTIRVRNVQPRGAAFTIEMPFQPPSQQRVLPSGTLAAASRAGKILLVDQDVSVLEAVSGILRARNHQVRPASNLAEAQQALRDQEYDMVVADLQSYEGAGDKCLRWWLRLHRPSLAQRVVLMRASAPTASQSDAELGALQILQKPFKAGELLAVIESVLSDAGAVSVER